MSSAFGFSIIIGLGIYGVLIVLMIMVIYTLLLAIKALKIYIQKNS